MAKTKTKKQDANAANARADDAGRGQAWRRLAWVLAALAWVFVVMSLIDFNLADWPGHAVSPVNWPVTNWCGPAGAAAAYYGYFTLGPGIWVLLAGILAALVATAAGRRISQAPLRLLGTLVCAVAVSGFVALRLPNVGVMPEGAGGLLAIALIDLMVVHFSHVGTMIVLTGMLVVGLVVAVDELVAAFPQWLGRTGRRVGGLRLPRLSLAGVGAMLPGRRAGNRSGMMLRPRPRHPAEPPADADDLDQTTAAVDEAEPDAEDTRPVRPGDRPTAAEADDEASADEADQDHACDDVEVIDEDQDTDDEDEADDIPADGRARLTPEALKEKISKLPISFAKPAPAEPPAPPQQDLSDYRFPTMDLLVEPEHSFSEEIAAHVREQAEILERALQTYRIDAEVVAIDAGPVITLYEVALAPGTKVSQLNTVSSDVARELKAQSIRIVPNTAGKSTVGIEVPNLKKEKVRLKDLMALGGTRVRDDMALPMYLGKDASGDPLIADLAKMPHMLIAGTTGSGKSVCMNSIIMSFLFTRRPDELKLILVDPKMVEMSLFKEIPHLMCPVVTDMGKAAAILEWAVTKMDERYELLSEAACRDIDSYNRLEWEDLQEIFQPQTEAEEAKIPKKLYRMVFVIDELADLMMTNKEVENDIVRIAQKARAVGIHLILATQRPQANVVTGLIKSNMPCRVSFQVASGMDSRIVLDSKGAELLLGQGDMLFLSPRTSKLTRAQGTLVDDAEIRKSVRFLKDVAEPSFEPQLVQIRSADQKDVDSEAASDPLFEDAVRVVLETQRGSVSLLQRRLTIGYSRASRLVEAMAMAGILGTHKGSQAREVTMTIDDWEQMREQLAAQPGMQANFRYQDNPDDLGQTTWDQADDDHEGVPDEMDDEYRG